MLSNQVNHLEKSLQELKDQKSQQSNPSGGYTLSHTLSQAIYDSKLIKEVMDDTFDEIPEPQKAAILERECQRLGLDPVVIAKEIQEARDSHADFIIYEDCDPWSLFQTFLEGRKLGPAGNDLYLAIKYNHTLSDVQEELLSKVCLKINHPDWPAGILKSIDTYQSHMAHLQQAPAGVFPEHRLPWEPLPVEEDL